jgi:cell division initiation protein
MRITPVDIQQVAFGIRFRGYDRKEVDDFLDILAKDYEMLIRENQEVQEKTVLLMEQLAEMKKKEGTLNSTLIAVQKVVEEMKQNAQKEVDLLLKEAEMRAEEVTKGAKIEQMHLQQEIQDLHKQKALFLEKIRSVIRAFEKTVELEEKEFSHEKKDRIRVW